MKEPWRVFTDALREELARHDVEEGGARAIRRVPEVDVPRMSTAIANTILEHLKEDRGLGNEEALQVTQLFFAELARESSEAFPGRLERVWKGWAATH